MDYNKLFTYNKLRFKRTESLLAFEDFPNEVLNAIFVHLETNELLNLSRTNSRFFKLIKPWIYKKILVYDPAVFRRLDYADESVMGTFHVDYTVISIKNFIKLTSTYSFEPELITCVYFYFCSVTSELLDLLPAKCTIEIQTRLDKRKSVLPRLKVLVDVFFSSRSSNASQGMIKVSGSCLDYRSSCAELDETELSNEVKSLDLHVTSEMQKNLESRKIRFENLTSLSFRGALSNELIHTTKLEHLIDPYPIHNGYLSSDDLRKTLKDIEIHIDSRHSSNPHDMELLHQLPNPDLIVVDCKLDYHSYPPNTRELYHTYEPIKYNLLERTRSIVNTSLVEEFKDSELKNLKLLKILGYKDQYYKVIHYGDSMEFVPVFKETSPINACI